VRIEAQCACVVGFCLLRRFAALDCGGSTPLNDANGLTVFFTELRG
jgi:hypothetical protein